LFSSVFTRQRWPRRRRGQCGALPWPAAALVHFIEQIGYEVVNGHANQRGERERESKGGAKAAGIELLEGSRRGRLG